MSEPGAKAPTAYKFCDAHFVANCPICAEQQPNPSGDPLPIIKMPDNETETAISRSSAPPPPPKPQFTDPTALAVTEASSRFAAAREAVTFIQTQLQEMLTAINSLRQKEIEAQEELAKAQAGLMEAISGKS